MSAILNGFTSRLTAFGLAFLAQVGGDFWLPDRAASGAGQVDSLFYLIFWISLFFFVLIVGLMIIFILRYRQRKGHEPEESPHHNTALELTWSLIPLALVIVIFYLGFKSFLDMSTPPQGAHEIQVTGQKWKWLFTYPNGYVDEELHLPVNEPVNLVLTSEDVIHSLFIPAFRIKKDAVPGRYTKTWFEPNQPGQYLVLCAEYCGTGHSDMSAWAVVHPPGEYETWLATAGDFLATLTPVEGGERLYKVLGCGQCHTVDGAPGIGPTFRDLYGTSHALQDGGTVTVDENYVRESLLDPLAKVSAGFQPVMPTFQGKVADREITAIIAYLKTLTPEGQAPEGQEQPEEQEE